MKLTIEGFHKAFESRIRLGIMSALTVNEAISFNELKDFLDLTDGNLASHLKALEKEKFIAVSKTFVGRKPLTRYYATKEGVHAFGMHLRALENLIQIQK